MPTERVRFWPCPCGSRRFEESGVGVAYGELTKRGYIPLRRVSWEIYPDTPPVCPDCGRELRQRLPGQRSRDESPAIMGWEADTDD